MLTSEYFILAENIYYIAKSIGFPANEQVWLL